MTTKPVTPPPDAGQIIQFPDAPPEELTGFHSINYPAHPAALAEHFGNRDSTVILSEVAAALIPAERYEGVLYPDLLVAFGVNPAMILPRNGYSIPEQGKPPDFVMEVASDRTARRDETVKPGLYAAMAVPEYWRFDPTGGGRYQEPLAGDRLVDGTYVPIPIHQTDGEHLWGHSDALNLDLCWEEGNLRFWDPVARRYLTTFMEEVAARRAAEARAAAEAARATAEAARATAEAARAAAEAARAAAAEARVQRLEEKLRRQGP